MYFGLPAQLQALSTEVWFCAPACEFQTQEDPNTLMTWHGDRQPQHSSETGRPKLASKEQSRYCSANHNIQVRN